MGSDVDDELKHAPTRGGTGEHGAVAHPGRGAEHPWEGEARAEAARAMFAADDPLALFAAWFAAAAEHEPEDPNAMALATVDPAGLPDVRMVLLKDAGPGGFAFYSHVDGVKGGHLAANPQAAVCFHWKSLRRQVRTRGEVAAVPEAEADAYYASRARVSRLGAWASRQSRAIPGREVLEAEVARLKALHGDGPIPRPSHWGGFRLAPSEIEFWLDGPFRLHDRRRFTRDGTGWTSARLSP